MWGKFLRIFDIRFLFVVLLLVGTTTLVILPVNADSVLSIGNSKTFTEFELYRLDYGTELWGINPLTGEEVYLGPGKSDVAQASGMAQNNTVEVSVKANEPSHKPVMVNNVSVIPKWTWSDSKATMRCVIDIYLNGCTREEAEYWPTRTTWVYSYEVRGFSKGSGDGNNLYIEGQIDDYPDFIIDLHPGYQYTRLYNWNTDHYERFSLPVKKSVTVQGSYWYFESIPGHPLCTQIEYDLVAEAKSDASGGGGGLNQGYARYAFKSLKIEFLPFTNRYASARFTFTPKKVIQGESVDFDSSASLSYGSAEYLWDFGNGQPSDERNPAYTFSKPGYYNVSLRVTNDNGSTSKVTKRVYVFPSEAYSDFTYSPDKIRISDKIEFNATNSASVSPISLYDWDFGDTQYDSSISPVVYHNYAEPGSYIVNLTIHDTAGGSSSCSKVVNVTIPVILVHGFNADASTWYGLEQDLRGTGYQVYGFDYSGISGSTDPRIPADWLAIRLNQFRDDLSYNGQKYSGKYDIVCHSMGALVTRWYIEEMGGGQNVRQWIGVAPVNNGAATADFAEMAPDVIKDLISFFDKDAIFYLRTDSPVVQELENNGRYPGVKYRIITGYNGNQDPMFFGGVFGGKTWNMIPIFNGTKTYYLTWLGDGIVPLDGSLLDGAETDCLNGRTHFMTDDPLVRNVVISYIENISRPSTNIIPYEQDFSQQSYINSEGWYWNGQLRKLSSKLLLAVIVAKGDPLALFRINWLGSDVDMTLISPTGERIGPGSDRVLAYSKLNHTIEYLVNTTESGEWTAEIDPVDIPESGEPVTFSAFFNSSLRLVLECDHQDHEYVPGELAMITAEIWNETMKEAGVNVSAVATRPDGTNETIFFHDDGSEGDSVAGDGTLSTSYPVLNPGCYSFEVTATRGGEQQFARSGLLIVEVAPQPYLEITDISPGFGIRGTSVPVVITGTGFAYGQVTNLAKAGSPNITLQDGVSGSLHVSGIFNLSGLDEGSWDVVVTNPDGESTTLTDGFIIALPPSPNVSSVNPAHHRHGGKAFLVIINGTDFQNGVTGTKALLWKALTSKNITATKMTVDSSAGLTCFFKIPKSVKTGRYNVTVINPDGQSGTLVNGFKVKT